MMVRRKKCFFMELFVWIALDRLAHDADNAIVIETGLNRDVTEL